jgi:hemolysin activation/secretion protein
MAPEPGAINLILDVEEKKNGFAVGYDSRESRIVNSGRINASAFGYSLLREGDVLRGRLAATPDGQQSQTASLQYATPIGANGLKLDVAAVYQATHPSSVPIDGSATFFSAGLSYPLLLDFHREVALSAVVDHTESRNSALGSVFANERVDAARFGIRAGLIQENRSINGSLTYARGLDLENAESAVVGAETGFNKISATAGVVQKLSKNLFLRLRASGQWTDDILPANERLMYGGIEYGRGFDNGVISFDKGYEAVFEPAWRPISQGDFAKSELYLFADYGEGNLSLPRSMSRDFNLGSVGIGARIGYKDYATLGLEYAEPWDVPVTGFSDDSVVTVSWAFKYQP